MKADVLPIYELEPFLPLPITQTAEGTPRRVGIELEFTGIPLPLIAQQVAEVFDGTITEHGRNIHYVDCRYGRFNIELDVKLLKEWSNAVAEQRAAGQPPGKSFESLAEEYVSPLIAQISPYEVVSPPLPQDALDQMEILAKRLAKAGAVGTDASPIYSFGLQFNPEVPSLDAETLHTYLVSFALLYDWLKDQVDMTLTRQLIGWASAYPVAYVERLLHPDYRPDMAQLIDDYLAYNSTRNRALDMLPVFAWIDEPRVRAKATDVRIQKRPTFHYRLPNSRLDRDDWSISREWNRWVQVERLAGDARMRQRLAASYRKLLQQPLGLLTVDWSGKVEEWFIRKA